MAYFSIEKVQVAWGPLGQRKQVPSQSQSKGHSSQQNSNCSFTNSSATIPQTSGTLLFQTQMCPSGSFWSKIFLMHIKNIKPGSQRWRLITRHLYKESNTFNMCLISPLFQHSYRLEIITHAVAGIQFFPSFFCTISQKQTEIESPNVTQTCPTVIPVNPFILGSNGQRSRSRVTKTLSASVFFAPVPVASSCRSL